MNREKIISYALVFILICVNLFSCSSVKTSDKSETSSLNTNVTTEAGVSSGYADDLPSTMDFEGYNFRVFTRDKLNLSAEYAKYFVPVEENGDIVNDTAYIRNRTVEERFNVKITFVGTTEDRASNPLMTSIMAGDDEYDIAVIWRGVSDTPVKLIQNNCIVNLLDMPYMDLDAEWYFPNMTDLLTLNGKLFAAGSYYLNADPNMLYMIFNKKLAKSLSIGNLYDTVRSEAWTWDSFLDCIKDTYEDLNGNGISDYGDRFGYFNHSGLTQYLLAGFGLNTVEKNNNGTYSPLISGERLVTALELLQKLCNSNPDVYENKRTDPSNTFMDGNAFITTNGTSWLDLRAIEDFDFGVVPFPKYDEIQENYFCFVYPDSFVVPVTVKNIDACGAIIEALSAASYTDLAPVLEDIYIEQKLLRDNESIEMINLMKKNVLVDYTSYYDFSNGILGSYAYANNIIHSKSAAVSSSLASLDSQLNSLAEKFYSELFNLK